MVRFKRSALTASLPEPEPGGDILDLWHFVNVAEEDRPAMLAWLIHAQNPGPPHPLLYLSGSEGAGKTTATSALVSLIDPSHVPIRKTPRDPEGLITVAANSHAFAVDNVNTIQPWLSDGLCRIVTGEGDVRRKLYTDSEVVLYSFRRVVILTGIDIGAQAGDLADRMLTITLKRIPDSKRMEDEDLKAAWAEAYPCIFGALLDLAVKVLAVLPTVKLKRKPRMADYARVLAAVDQVMGTNGLERYAESRTRMAADTLTGDPFIVRLTESLSEIGFEGTSGELLQLLTPDTKGWRKPKGWPANARTATQRLRSYASALQRVGWRVTDDGGSNKAGVVQWRIDPPEPRKKVSSTGGGKDDA